MKIIKWILIGILPIISACGGDSGDKNLFSSWSSVPGGTVLDMSNVDFGTITVAWVLQNCTSSMTIGGTQSSGTAVISGATGGTGCAALNGSYTYTKTVSQLTVCQNSTCTTYQ